MAARSRQNRPPVGALLSMSCCPPERRLRAHYHCSRHATNSSFQWKDGCVKLPRMPLDSTQKREYTKATSELRFARDFGGTEARMVRKDCSGSLFVWEEIRSQI